MLNSDGDLLLPCVYDNIKRINEHKFVVLENNEKKEIKIDSLISYHREEHYYSETHHYSNYSGSYAQDEMGYSDEDIDTIFDGDPDAYWNID